MPCFGLESCAQVYLVILCVVFLLAYYQVNALHCFACTSDDRKCPSQASVDAHALKPVECRSSLCLTIVGRNDPAGAWRGCAADTDIRTSQKSGCYTQGRQMICVCDTDGCNGFPVGFVQVNDKMMPNLDYLRTHSAKPQRLALINMAARMSRDPWWRKTAPKPTTEQPETSFKVAKLKSIRVVDRSDEDLLAKNAQSRGVSGADTQRSESLTPATREAWVPAGHVEETVYEQIHELPSTPVILAPSGGNQREAGPAGKYTAHKHASADQVAAIVSSTPAPPAGHEAANVSSSNGSVSAMSNVKSKRAPDTKSSENGEKMGTLLSGEQKTEIPYLERVNQLLRKLNLEYNIPVTIPMSAKEAGGGEKRLPGEHALEPTHMLHSESQLESKNEQDGVMSKGDGGLSLAEWNQRLDAAGDAVSDKPSQPAGGVQDRGFLHAGKAGIQRPVWRDGQTKGMSQGSHLSVRRTTRLIDLLMQILETPVRRRLTKRQRVAAARHYPTTAVGSSNRPRLRTKHPHLMRSSLSPTPNTRGQLAIPRSNNGFDFRSLAPEESEARNQPKHSTGSSWNNKIVTNEVNSVSGSPIGKVTTINKVKKNLSDFSPRIHSKQRHGWPRARLVGMSASGRARQHYQAGPGSTTPRGGWKDSPRSANQGRVFSKKADMVTSATLNKGGQKIDHVIRAGGSASEQQPASVRKAGAKTKPASKVLRARKTAAMERYHPPWMHRSTYFLDKGLAAWGNNRRRQMRWTSGAGRAPGVGLGSLIMAAGLLHLWLQF